MRQRAVDRRQLIDVPVEIQKEDAMDLEKVKEGMVHSLEKIKFGRKVTEDIKSMSSVDEVIDTEALLIGEIPISLNCHTVSLTLPTIFKSKNAEEDLVEVEGKHHKTEEDKGHCGITIKSSEECRPQKVILEKPIVEMTRHIKILYERAHLNGIPVSKVLIDNGSAINVMPLRMLRALGRSISDMIETEVTVSAFIGEVSNTLEILPIGSKTSLFAFFVIDSTTNYNILLGRDWIHANWCVSFSLYQFLLFWNGNEVKVVRADKQPLMAATGIVEARYYDQEFGPINFTNKRKDEVPRKAYRGSKGFVEIQKEMAKLLKVTTIVPYKKMSGLIIAKINDD